ncbi:MAG: hypothetical protein P4L92_10235 [Rudaea sp.]|nr:hypothetical protein [Rudaea sp.]
MNHIVRRWIVWQCRVLLMSIIAFAVAGRAQADDQIVIAGHVARFDAAGHLLPWIPWTVALEREMQFYTQCPADHGYPRFVTETFLQSDWTPDPNRRDTIPATQNGMGILSYLKFHALHGKRDAIYLDTARAMGDYLLHEALTPPAGKYPRFARSTGTRGQFPLSADTGSQADHPYEIEPDKGGIAGYALVQLFQASGEHKYLAQALHLARVLAANQQVGDGSHSPWPFRADYRTGAGRGAVSGNMTYILRLYDALKLCGYREFQAPRQALWRWIKRYQIPSTAADGALFAQFFEDHDSPTNRTAWAPLNLARYLLEQRAALDPDWRADAATLIHFVRSNFTHVEFGVTVCHEQDEDHEAWGGVNSTYGAVLALYAKAIGSAALASEARQALNFTLYSIDDEGRPRDLFKHAVPGGWQEDAHTDVIHNYVDALNAFPAWAKTD